MIWLSRVGMDSDQLVYVLLSDFGEKIPVFFSGSKIFLSRSQLLAKLQEQRLSDFLLLSSIQLNSSSAIELTCLYERENEPDERIFEFCTPELSV